MSVAVAVYRAKHTVLLQRRMLYVRPSVCMSVSCMAFNTD